MAFLLRIGAGISKIEFRFKRITSQVTSTKRSYKTMYKAHLPPTDLLEEFMRCPTSTVLVVLGATLTPPGIHIVQGTNKEHRCLVHTGFGTSRIFFEQNISVPVDGCTHFRIYHLDEKYDESLNQKWLNQLLEQSLSAVSELTIWSKHHEQVGLESRYWSRSGIIDAKYFALLAPQGDLISADWVNERFRFNYICSAYDERFSNQYSG